MELITKLITENLGWCIVGSVTLIQISPLRIDPWTYIGKAVQGILGITGIQKRLDEMEKKADEKRMKQLRAAILDYANSCRNKQKHTYAEFQDVFRWYAEYNELIDKYGFENHFLEDEYEYIRKIFHRCQEENSFLEQINENEERMR